MTRRFADSREILEWCVIGMISVLVALMLLHLVARAMNVEMDYDQARLDSQITPAQRAEVAGREDD